MLAKEIISQWMIPLQETDTVERANQLMFDFKVNHLPIVSNEQKFIGLITDQDIIEVIDYSLPISQITLKLVNSFVYHNQHIYDVLALFHYQNLSIIPVVDENNYYLGLIKLTDLLHQMADITAITESGSIIVIEINRNDNSLAHIAQIVESENAQILSSYTRYFAESTKMEVTLKLNKNNINQIVAALLRYKYIIKATFNQVDNNSDIANRYELLMNYLSF